MSDLGQSSLDVRRASEQLSIEELKFFLEKVSLSELCSPTTPVAPTGVWKRCRTSDRVTAYRNVLGVSLSFWACFSSLVVLANLQSSLNADDGLGLASLVVLNLSQALGVFLSASIVGVVGTKYGMIAGYVGFLVYTLTNFYPSWYTLIPSSIIVGLSLGAAVGTSIYSHVTSVAVKSAQVLKEDPKYLIAMFTGVLTFSYKLGYIPGNLLSSVVLFNDRIEHTSIAWDIGICNNTEAANLDKLYVYIMLSVFVVFDVVGITTAIFCVDDLRANRKFMSVRQYFSQRFAMPSAEMLKIILNWKLLLLAPMILYDTLLISFMIGLYAKKYVSDCIGVRWVGLVLMTYGAASGLGGLVSGRLAKCLSQYLITYTVCITSLGILLFHLFWVRAPLYYVQFTVAGLLGACEGSLSSVIASLTGILFFHQQEAAFSANRFWFGLGFTIGFLFTLLVSVRVQLWLMVAQLVISLLTYSILILKTLSRDQLFPCLAQKSESVARDQS